MVEPQTAQEVLERLENEGYTESFMSDENGLRALTKNMVIDPGEFIVDKLYRFEGETNLDDEEIIFALHWPREQLKGTYHIAFGPKMDPLDAEIVQHLRRRYKNGTRI